MDKLQIERIRDRLQSFDFKSLFTDELGWSHVRGAKPVPIKLLADTWQATPIAELSGVVAFLVVGLPDRETRLAIHKVLSEHTHENLVIFTDKAKDATQSLWLWVKREGSKRFPREHLYVKGQPGDLFISKISGIVVDINELDEQGRFPLAQLVERMRSALDVERITKTVLPGIRRPAPHLRRVDPGHPRRARPPLVCVRADEPAHVCLVPPAQTLSRRR